MKPGSTSAACFALIRRDLTLVWRRRGDALNPILFALIVVALFPLALGPEPDNLRRIAAGTVFVALLLRACSHSTRFFAATMTTARWSSWCFRRIRSRCCSRARLQCTG